MRFRWVRAIRPAQLTAVAAKHPERFLPRGADGQFGTLKQRGGQPERISHVDRTSIANWKQQTAIVVTDGRKTAVVSDERSAECGQTRCDVRKQVGVAISSHAPDRQGKQVEVEHVAVIVGGSFCVSAVPAYLPVRFISKNPTTDAFPARGRGKLRQHTTGSIERQTFAKQMSVRTEVRREVSADMV